MKTEIKVFLLLSARKVVYRATSIPTFTKFRTEDTKAVYKQQAELVELHPQSKGVSRALQAE